MEQLNFSATYSKLTTGGKCVLPKIFWENITKKVGVQCTNEGIILQPATDESSITISKHSKGDLRVTIPRDVLRVFDAPNMFEITFVAGQPDTVLLKPMYHKCVSCGKRTNLIELQKYEYYVCRDCLNEAFGIALQKKR